MTDSDLAAEDRRRLAKLLEVDTDKRLRAASAGVPPLAGADWSEGFVDTRRDVQLAAYFIADPDERQQATSSALQSASGETLKVSTNGALLLVARTRRGDQKALDRVNELLTRFAGKE